MMANEVLRVRVACLVMLLQGLDVRKGFGWLALRAGNLVDHLIERNEGMNEGELKLD